MPIRTAQEALTQRPLTFLRSAWPWRSLAYLTSGAVFGALVLCVLAGLVLGGVLLTAVLVGVVVLLAALLLGVPVARFERWRLRLVDVEPAHDPHRTPSEPGVRAWVRTRLREQATWREFCYSAVWAAALWWLDGGVVAGAGYALVACLAAPVYGDPAWATLGFFAGLVLIPVTAYGLTAWAGARAALTRAVLAPRDDELGERLVEVSRSRARLVDAFELERRRIERDLHDGAQQRLVALTVSLGLVRLDLPDGSPAAAQVDEAHRQAKEALAELRELIRGVHPQVLTGRGLSAAVADVSSRSPVPVEVDVSLPRRLPPQVEFAAYVVVCEALANATKHARASSLRVHGRLDEDVLVIEVRDDGVGGADPARGSGLAGLADRVAVADGRLLLASPPGGPTTVRAEFTCSG
jgi:signal transduction histidine kinase